MINNNIDINKSKDQILKIAEGVKKARAHILKAGIIKPRSSVYSFKG